MTAQKRFFTPQEANQALPRVAPLAERARSIARKFRVLDPADQAGRDSLRQEVIDVVNALREHGVEIGGLTDGQLAFPGVRLGREVRLCWKIGQPGVQFWHDPDVGAWEHHPIDQESWVWEWYD